MMHFLLAFMVSFQLIFAGQAKPEKKKIRQIPNVEIQAKVLKHNDNYIYLLSKTEKIKLIRKELTPEGDRQIVENEGKELTLFVPETSIKYRRLIDKRKGDL